MVAITKYLGVGIAAGALAGATPVAAQYSPGYGSPYGNGSPYGYGSPYGGNPYGYSPQGYGYGNNQAMISQCTSAVQARLSGGYGGYGANPYGPNPYGGGAYGGGPYGGGRVVGVSRVEPDRNGGFTVRGVATSGYSAYGYANSPNLVWLCRTDFRGVVIDVEVERARPNNGYRNPPGNYDYSPYGYQRY
ncbi:MAG TPA: hypothetical protein VGQ34_07635 [Sphingomicrobium sp.]|jgi:hypothetical protein|nr:hypothetical protein [Sphingomicrobium sp.]